MVGYVSAILLRGAAAILPYLGEHITRAELNIAGVTRGGHIRGVGLGQVDVEQAYGPRTTLRGAGSTRCNDHQNVVRGFFPKGEFAPGTKGLRTWVWAGILIGLIRGKPP